MTSIPSGITKFNKGLKSESADPKSAKKKPLDNTESFGKHLNRAQNVRPQKPSAAGYQKPVQPQITDKK